MSKGTVLCSYKRADALENNCAIKKMTNRTEPKGRKLFLKTIATLFSNIFGRKY